MQCNEWYVAIGNSFGNSIVAIGIVNHMLISIKLP